MREATSILVCPFVAIWKSAFSNPTIWTLFPVQFSAYEVIFDSFYYSTYKIVFSAAALF